MSLEALEELLKNYGGTIIFISHERHFISEILTKTLSFEDEDLSLVAGTYKQYLSRAQRFHRNTRAKELMKVELNITNVLSQLGDPTLSDEEKDELEDEFQKTLAEKRTLTQEA